MSNLLSLTVPLPPHHCSSNSRSLHWGKKSRAAKQAKWMAFVEARRQHPGVKLTGKVRVHHYWDMGKTKLESMGIKDDPVYRPLDVQNAISALKATIDGIVESGLIEGDTHKLLEWGECELRRHVALHQGKSGVTLVFEEIPS